MEKIVSNSAVIKKIQFGSAIGQLISATLQR